MRTRKKPWAAMELRTNLRIVHDPKERKGRWHEYFGNANEIDLEIGCGKGRFIAAMADENIHRNFIGLERDATILAAAARNGLQVSDNAHLAYIGGDAEQLSEIFAPGEIQTLYINFCDPWPNKKKWAKRRLTHRRFLDLYRQLAIGVVFVKTDNRKLFEFSLEQFSEAVWRLTNISLDLYAAAPKDTRFMTEYEEKFLCRQAPIYRLEAYDTFLEVSPYERTNNQAEKSSASNVLQSAQE